MVGNWAERHAHLVFIVPTMLVMFALLGFPLLYTLYMSVHEWFIASTRPPEFIGIQNFVQALTSTQFQQAVVRTLYYTVLAVAIPALLGLVAALVFAQQFYGRGLLRTIFIFPMTATPVAIALIWVMMFHPSLGVLNYLLSLVGLPSSLWIFSRQTVIPSLVMVETWHTTPFMMLIILGGLATLPVELFEAATVDGANALQKFRYVTLPLIWPYIMVAVLLRTIDALKSFDSIYVMTQGGPGNASETINIYLYLQAFAYYHIGYASAVVLLFFLLVIAASLLLIRLRRTYE
jgi:multiple sugar transport system permease protein